MNVKDTEYCRIPVFDMHSKAEMRFLWEWIKIEDPQERESVLEQFWDKAHPEESADAVRTYREQKANA